MKHLRIIRDLEKTRLRKFGEVIFSFDKAKTLCVANLRNGLLLPSKRKRTGEMHRLSFVKVLICSLFALWQVLPATAQIPLSDSRVVVRNEEKVNTEYLEYSPAFYREGIVFITNRHESLKATAEDTRLGQNIMALYESKRDEDGFLKNSQLFSSELLERVHQGPMTFNRTGETIYFTRNVLDKKDKAEDGLRKLMVYESKKEGSKWSEPLLLPFNNQECNTMHPVIGETDSILIFASDRPGGFGGMDLYRVVKQFDDWGYPENLGETVNTGGNEVFPFFHPDGTLYFASDNHGSLGGLDMFMTRNEDGNWTSPANLQAPFNTEKDDFGFIIDQDNRNGYFSSNRLNGRGGDDIYSFEYFGDSNDENKKESIVEKDLQVKDSDDNPIEGATISWINLDNVFLGKTENGKESIRLVPNGKSGEFTLKIGDEDGFDGQVETDMTGFANVLVDENGNYILKIEKDGFIPKQIIVKPGTDWTTLDLTMQRSTDCVALRGYVRVQGKSEGQGNTKIVFVNTVTSEEIRIHTDPDGSYVYCLPCNQDFTMYAVKNGIYAPTQIISFKPEDCGEGKEYVQDFTFPVDPGTSLVEGDIIELPNIYFNFNDAGIRRDAERDLEVVLQMMQNAPDMAIELGSHTDARGSSSYNQNLSQRRSNSVRKWLTNRGIGEGRTAAVGYGETRIRNGCTNGTPCTESEHQQNRRTEFKIISLDNPLLGQSQQKLNYGFSQQKNVPVNVSPSDNAANAYRAISINQEGGLASFTVIAGTFGSRENAQKRWQQLQNVNCRNASIVQREDGMFVVEAKQFADRNEAEALAERLERREGIGTYVKAN